MSPNKTKQRITIILIGIIAAVWSYDTAIKVSKHPDTPVAELISDLSGPTNTKTREAWDAGRHLGGFLFMVSETLNDCINWLQNLYSQRNSNGIILHKEFSWDELQPGCWVKLKSAKECARIMKKKEAGWGLPMSVYGDTYVQFKGFSERCETLFMQKAARWVWHLACIDTNYPIIPNPEI